MSDAPVPADDDRQPGREHALGDRTAPWWAWAGAALVALAVATSAGLFRRDDFWLVAAVFTVCVLPPATMLGWFLVVRPRTNAPEPHAEENVERRWTERRRPARSGTCSSSPGSRSPRSASLGWS